MKKVQIELVRSVIGTPEWMRVIVRTLALRKLRDKVVVTDTPAIRGMVNKVPHLVELKELEG
jgi:large subunit ribosomal protein L30